MSRKPTNPDETPARPRIDPLARNALALIRCGETDQRITELTGLTPSDLDALATDDPILAERLSRARRARPGGVAATIRFAMLRQINKGNTWWTRLALANYPVHLRDPDAASAPPTLEQFLSLCPDFDKSAPPANRIPHAPADADAQAFSGNVLTNTPIARSVEREMHHVNGNGRHAPALVAGAA